MRTKKPKILKIKYKILKIIWANPQKFSHIRDHNYGIIYYRRGWFQVQSKVFYYYCQYYVRTYPRLDYIKIYQVDELGKKGLLFGNQIKKLKIERLLRMIEDD